MKKETLIWLLVVALVAAVLFLVDFGKLFGGEANNVSVTEIESEVDESSFELEQAEKLDNLDDDIPDFVN